MEMGNLVDTLLSIVVFVCGWFLKESYAEQKRIQILVNRTREEYATKMELRDDMNKVIDALHRVEDKLDKVLQRN